MISRAHRFHGRSALNDVYRRGKMVRGPLFAVRVINNPKRKGYRVAIVVSRKVSKSAVARNRIRRRLYVLASELMQDIEEAYDVVITVFQADVISEQTARLREQLGKQLQHAGVLK